MKIAFVIFEQMTALDFVGVFDPLTRLKTMNFRTDVSWEICGTQGRVLDGAGLVFEATQVGKPLSGFELLIVPGGWGTRSLKSDTAFIDWLRTAKDCQCKASVCTGSLLLGAAGYLHGKRATTHPGALEELKPYCAEVARDRVVEDSGVITAGGVTSAIDLGLYLCRKFAGETAARKIANQMDYRGAGL